MAKILIDMEMPKSCASCEWSYYVGNGRAMCRRVSKTDKTDIMTKRRADFCPLVAVPPHGRLIDADALIINNCEKYIKSLNPDRDGKEIAKIRWLVGILNEQPTIIEAEGSEG